VPPGDAQAAAAALRRAAADGELRSRLSEAGRRTYADRASERVLGSEWRALLERQAGIV
jgi:glycosyltransferase involved in cell wall biosynthesis